MSEGKADWWQEPLCLAHTLPSPHLPIVSTTHPTYPFYLSTSSSVEFPYLFHLTYIFARSQRVVGRLDGVLEGEQGAAVKASSLIPQLPGSALS